MSGTPDGPALSGGPPGGVAPICILGTLSTPPGVDHPFRGGPPRPESGPFRQSRPACTMARKSPFGDGAFQGGTGPGGVAEALRAFLPRYTKLLVSGPALSGGPPGGVTPVSILGALSTPPGKGHPFRGGPSPTLFRAVPLGTVTTISGGRYMVPSPSGGTGTIGPIPARPFGVGCVPSFGTPLGEGRQGQHTNIEYHAGSHGPP